MPRPAPGVPLYSRNRAFRSQTPVYFFVEGETEEDYIRHLNSETAEFHLIIEERSTDRRRLVEDAIALRKSRMGKAADLRRPHEYPRTWCVFDYDDDDRVDSLFRKAARHGVQIAFSHPCLELWWLLHFQPVTSSLDADTIKMKLGRLSQTRAFRGLSKNKHLTSDRWNALQELYPTARMNAQKLISHCGCICRPPHHGEDCVPSKRSPSCNMADLVDSLKIIY
ncbi:RloB family protein [Nonomuraea basaltis]|uniref:RloB family protein n=1 Tax=Nonomuraea basaltis TaxID=2495887 RepID=UPI00110C5500|nr:RloB family protein [Nonomuraea basaltis]TMR94752.1 RloB domain-containing protein [Nonomuraea basaltis]